MTLVAIAVVLAVFVAPELVVVVVVVVVAVAGLVVLGFVAVVAAAAVVAVVAVVGSAAVVVVVVAGLVVGVVECLSSDHGSQKAVLPLVLGAVLQGAHLPKKKRPQQQQKSRK